MAFIEKLKMLIIEKLWICFLCVFILGFLFPIFMFSDNYFSRVSKEDWNRVVTERDIAASELSRTINELSTISDKYGIVIADFEALSILCDESQKRIDELEFICEENEIIVSEEGLIKLREEARIRQEAEDLKSAFEKFKEGAVSVSYDDLIRYPDTYKTTPIKVTVYVKDEDVDKMFGILQGGYLCTMDKQDLAVYDNRTLKEPRLRKGDTVTIYGYSGGLAKMQKKKHETTILGLVVDNVVDEWYVPDVRIEYVSIK